MVAAVTRERQAGQRNCENAHRRAGTVGGAVSLDNEAIEITEHDVLSVRYIPIKWTNGVFMKLISRANELGLEGKRITEVVVHRDLCEQRDIVQFRTEP